MHEIQVEPDVETYLNYVFANFDDAPSARHMLQVNSVVVLIFCNLIL